jgi:hypothetical protein
MFVDDEKAFEDYPEFREELSRSHLELDNFNSVISSIIESTKQSMRSLNEFGESQMSIVRQLTRFNSSDVEFSKYIFNMKLN